MLPVDPNAINPPHRLYDLLPAPGSEKPAMDGFQIRSFCDRDQAACRQLYSEGLLGGSLLPNDTGFDIGDIMLAYLAEPGSHFWVAENEDGQVVGMIGVQHHEQGVGEIRRLRVHPDHRRRGIGSALVETAVRFCNERQYLKVTVDTFVDHEAVTKLLAKFNFRLSRAKPVGDREMLYFYLDLYQSHSRRPVE